VDLKKESFIVLKGLIRGNRWQVEERSETHHLKELIPQKPLLRSQPRWIPVLPPVAGCARDKSSLSLDSLSTKSLS
jgi:hypothetical protein